MLPILEAHHQDEYVREVIEEICGALPGAPAAAMGDMLIDRYPELEDLGLAIAGINPTTRQSYASEQIESQPVRHKPS